MSGNLKSVNADALVKAIDGKPDRARERLMYKHFLKKKFLLHWGGMADPFCYFEKVNRTGYKILKALGRQDYPTLFSFKGGAIFDKKYVKFFEKYADQGNFAFQVSIITYDEMLARDIEMGVPSPKMRLKATKMLSDMGYYTILRLRPFIIGVSDQGLDELLEDALDSGIQGVSMEFFAVDIRGVETVKRRNNWIGRLMGVKNFYQYFKDLSPSERGGYLRLNRLVKERFVKQVYEFCAKHNLVFGCSDPDFKELNTSGSCCGMPDNFPKNRGLENWTRSQLTYHLKEARRLYHSEGKKVKLKFDEVFGSESYFDDEELAMDHVIISDMCSADKHYTTLRTIARMAWNNLNSGTNPRNYFHGKLMPVGLDDEQNYIYEYTPMPYEDRWSDEGINLIR